MKDKLFNKFGIDSSWHNLKPWFNFEEGNLAYILSHLKNMESKKIKFCPLKRIYLKHCQCLKTKLG